jgi:PEP-CTERM motif
LMESTYSKLPLSLQQIRYCQYRISSLTQLALNIEFLHTSNANKPDLAAVPVANMNYCGGESMAKIKTLRLGLAALLVLLGSVSPAWCTSVVGASIVVDPDPGTPPPGEYWYSLAVPEPNGITFNPGDEIYFYGMSGVTGAFANTGQVAADAELGGAFANDVSFTASTATFGFAFPSSCTTCPTSDTFPNDQGAPYGTLVIDPPAGSTLGTIDWAIIQDGVTTFSGTVEGPVVATPEPSSLLLLCTGLLGLVGAKKFKLLVS